MEELNLHGRFGASDVDLHGQFNASESEFSGNFGSVQQIEVSATYIHRQYSAAGVWTINHNLHRYPSVTVVDSAGTKVYGDVDYIDDMMLRISFVAPFSGEAYLN